MEHVITEAARAKINLYLHVTGKREDGYHLLDSLVAFTEMSDELTFQEASEFTLCFRGWKYLTDLLNAEDIEKNLVMRAARAYAAHTGVKGAAIRLRKNIPMGSGMGGGSADAAATIKGLERLYETPLKKEVRERILTDLGADVPVCYRDKPCRMQGIGEILKEIPPLPYLPLLVIWPSEPVSTKDVFRTRENFFRDIPIAYPENFGSLTDFVEFLKTTNNDLANSAETLCPVIRDVRTWLMQQPGCLLSRMSGSGSSVFGIFDSDEARSTAFSHCVNSNPGWFTYNGQIIDALPQL